jgi:hypothetical protein
LNPCAIVTMYINDRNTKCRNLEKSVAYQAYYDLSC